MLGYAVAPHEGKGTGEQALLRQLLSRIYEGDIILGNAHFENYFLLVLLQLAGANVVFEKHGAQPIDFRQSSKRLGKKDGLFVLTTSMSRLVEPDILRAIWCARKSQYISSPTIC